MTNSDWNDRYAASDGTDGDVEFDPHALANAAADPALTGGSFWGEVLRDIPREGSSTNERLRIRALNARRAADAAERGPDAPVDLAVLNLSISLPDFSADDAQESDAAAPVTGEPLGTTESSDSDAEDDFAGSADEAAAFTANDVHFTVATSLSPERRRTPADLPPIDVAPVVPEPSREPSAGPAPKHRVKGSWLESLRERDAYEILAARRPLFYAAFAETILFMPCGLFAWYWLLRSVRALACDDYAAADYAAGRACTALWIGKNAILVLFILSAAALAFLALSGVGDPPKT